MAPARSGRRWCSSPRTPTRRCAPSRCALDYVTKPLRRDRVREALARARERVASRAAPRPPESLQPTAIGSTAPLALKADGRVRLIDQRAIDWIAADDDHVVVHAGDQSWRARGTLRELL